MPTKIAWTDHTWNPITGCSPATDHPGCDHCYARAFSRRGLTESHRQISAWDGTIAYHPERLLYPWQRWGSPGKQRKIFVTSMGDIGHPSVTDQMRREIYGVMLLAPWLTFQNLTKRPAELARFKREFTPDDCIGALLDMVIEGRLTGDTCEGQAPKLGSRWEDIGHIHELTSVSDQATANRLIPDLLSMPAAVRGVSLEPLVGPVDLLDAIQIGFGRRSPNDAISFVDGLGYGLDWLIIGAESGAGARQMDLAWVRSLLKQADGAGTPVFVKQLSKGEPKDFNAWPTWLQRREFPK